MGGGINKLCSIYLNVKITELIDCLIVMTGMSNCIDRAQKLHICRMLLEVLDAIVLNNF